MNVAEFINMQGGDCGKVSLLDGGDCDMAGIWNIAASRNDRTFMLFIASSKMVLTDYQRMLLCYDLITKTPKHGGGTVSGLLDGFEMSMLDDAAATMTPDTPSLTAADKTRNWIWKTSIDHAVGMQHCPRKYALLALRSMMDLDLKGVGKHTFDAATIDQANSPHFRKWQKQIRIEQAKIIAAIDNPFERENNQPSTKESIIQS